ncbi:MAG: hypothetical protein HGN29_07645 [Asgard group archaeon]|nr:hypothetical protein [Asgard group archaeon]
MAIKNKEKKLLIELSGRDEKKHKSDLDLARISADEIDNIIEFLFEISFKENSRSREHIHDNFKIKEKLKKEKNQLRSQGFFIF